MVESLFPNHKFTAALYSKMWVQNALWHTYLYKQHNTRSRSRCWIHLWCIWNLWSWEAAGTLPVCSGRLNWAKPQLGGDGGHFLTWNWLGSSQMKVAGWWSWNEDIPECYMINSLSGGVMTKCICTGCAHVYLARQDIWWHHHHIYMHCRYTTQPYFTIPYHTA